jgi:uncharacterized delta-60 repeat protein
MRWFTLVGALAGLTSVVASGPGAFSADGRLDPNFGPIGQLQVTVTQRAEWLEPFSDAVAAPGGGVFAITRWGTERYSVVPRTAVVRIGADGHPDSSFGGNGLSVPTDLNTASTSLLERPARLAVAGNRVLVVGDAPGYSPTSVVKALNFAGAIDASYDIQLDVKAYDVAVDSVGRLLVLGSIPSGQVLIERFTAAGQRDPSFGVAGAAVVPDAFLGRHLAIGPGDSVVAAFYGFNDVERLVRLTNSGSADPAFGVNGVRDITGLLYIVEDLAITSDGRPVVFGLAQVIANGITNQFGAVVKLTSTGAPDPSFGVAGRVDLVDTHTVGPGMVDASGQISGAAAGQIVRLSATGVRRPFVPIGRMNPVALLPSPTHAMIAVGELNGFPRYAVIDNTQAVFSTDRFATDAPAVPGRSVELPDHRVVIEATVGRVPRLLLLGSDGAAVPGVGRADVCDFCSLAATQPVDGKALIWTSRIDHPDDRDLAVLQSDGIVMAVGLSGGHVLDSTADGRVLWGDPESDRVALVDLAAESDPLWSVPGEPMAFGSLDRVGAFVGDGSEIHRLVPAAFLFQRDVGFGVGGAVQLAGLATGISSATGLTGVERRQDRRVVLLAATNFSGNMEDPSFVLATILLSATGQLESGTTSVVLAPTRSRGRAKRVNRGQFYAGPVLVTVDVSPMTVVIDPVAPQLQPDRVGRLYGGGARWTATGQPDPTFQPQVELKTIALVGDSVWDLRPDFGGLTILRLVAFTEGFIGITPSRLAETRQSTTIDGRFQFIGQRAAGTTTEIEIAGRAGIPATARNVALSVAAVDASEAGFLTVWPCTEPRPTASNINVVAGATVANTVITRLSPRGTVCVYTSMATDLIVDATATFDTNFAGVVPSRLLETRDSTTIDGKFQSIGRRPAGSTTDVEIRYRGGIGFNAANATLNVTAVDAADAGFITVWPCTEPRPTASTLNVAAGDTIANSVITMLSVFGRVCIYTSTETDLIVDATGWFDSFVGITPSRLLETRKSPTVDGQFENVGRRQANTTSEVQIAGRAGIPAGSTNATLNITAINAADAGFVTVWPCSEARPNASTLNVSAGGTIANAAVTKLSTTGAICIYTSTTTDLVVDVTGVLV